MAETDAWTSFNMVSRIAQGTTSVAFSYDSEHARIVQHAVDGSSIADTTYLSDAMSGALSEKFVSAGVTTWRDYLMADGRLVGERSCIGTSPCTTGAKWQFFVTDHLGSVAVATDGTVGSSTYGQVTSRMAFDPWGKQRNLDGSDDATCSLGLSNPTTRGFTGHEAIPSLCLINMNARVYDPTIARFASPDSIVPDPSDAQSYNRYTYVDNRPLSLTDPTGHDPSPCPGGGHVCKPYHWAGRDGAHADPYAHPEMKEFSGFSITETSFGDGSKSFAISYNSDGEQSFSQHKASGDANGLSAGRGSSSPASNCDPASVQQTDAAQNAAGINETVVVDVPRLPYSYTGPLDEADQRAAQTWVEDHLTDGTRLHLHSIDNETGFSVSQDRTVKISAKHFCVVCEGYKHEGTQYDYDQVEKGGYPGHAHTLRQGRLPGPGDTSGVDRFGRAYVLTPQGAFAVERPASEYIARQIIGDPLNGRQLEELGQTVRQWNQPGGAGCHVSPSSC